MLATHRLTYVKPDHHVQFHSHMKHVDVRYRKHHAPHLVPLLDLFTPNELEACAVAGVTNN